MKKNIRIIILLICFGFSGFSLAEAAYLKEIKVENLETSKNNSPFLKKQFVKTVLKKILKEKTDDEKINKNSNWALIISSIGLLLLIIGLAGVSILLIASIVVGIIGFILSIRALSMIKRSEDPLKHSGNRFKVILGIVFSAGAALIVPLTILLLLLALV
jgi:hypothetical protein